MKLRGILLDIDGTLLDSNPAHARAYAQALRGEGLDVSIDQISRLIGMGNEKLLPALGVHPTSPVGERVARQKKEIFERLLPSLRPFPAVRNLLERMKSRGLLLVVATSAEEDEVSGLLQQAGVSDLIDAKSSSSDAKSSKPDPDIVEAAIARSGRSRNELIMVGDTPYDVEAAGRAGVSIIALLSGGWRREDLERAAEIYEHPADLLARYDQSILNHFH